MRPQLGFVTASAANGLSASGLAEQVALGNFTNRTTGSGAVWGSALPEPEFFLYAGTGVVTCAVVGCAASWLFPAPRGKVAHLTRAGVVEEQQV